MIAVVLLLLLLALVSPAKAELTWFWTAESTTLNCTGTSPCSSGSDYSAGADTTGSISGASIDSSAAKSGTNGMLVNAGNDDIQFNSEAAIHNTAAGAIAFWFNVQTWSSGHSLIYVRDNASDNDRIFILLSGVDELQFQIQRSGGGTSTLTTTNANLGTGNWYFVVARWDDSANDRALHVYDSSGTEQGSGIEDLSTNFDVPSALVGTSTFRLGDNLSGGATVWEDLFMWGTAWVDGDTFYCNRDITTHANYAACASGGGVHNLMLLGVGK
jgi:hypothetical protein